jgi:stage II sporulation protein AB (anti-sigma F factor)
MKAAIGDDRTLTVDISDDGKGIEDVKQARELLFTTAPDNERTGMGFYFMEIFMDTVSVESSLGKGTTVHMSKLIGQ